MDRWGPMPGYAHCALRGNGYHYALGGRGARALRFDSTLRRRAGDAAPAPTRATSEARAAGLWGDAFGHMLHGVRAEQGCARSKERCACVLLGAMSGLQPSTGDHRRMSL